MHKITKQDGTDRVLWCADDALVLKLLTMALQPVLPVHRACVHIKGHGGGKQSVATLHHKLASGQYRFVCRTDVRGYYANIQKQPLLERLAQYVDCPIVLGLLKQFLYYSVESGGLFHTPQKGIPRSCSLSPLLAGFQLYELDCALHNWSQKTGNHYVRYMDDFFILARTRGQLRCAVRTLNQSFNSMGLSSTPTKPLLAGCKRASTGWATSLPKKGSAAWRREPYLISQPNAASVMHRLSSKV
ncbi:reverse transcriptase domain-containing protein [Vibrio coralliilyticus]|uniref:reverse transcriptase domain-containing protein n=1 Tax=Vibrio coralliilyticus TaxID=190893 RepID=UPI001E3944FC|nr:reverse transcriptase domain-containing protein [Vibrio coralliilyticus]MCC2525786.1 hypothetical protein [Vibrio coralliilyticus]